MFFKFKVVFFFFQFTFKFYFMLSHTASRKYNEVCNCNMTKCEKVLVGICMPKQASE